MIFQNLILSALISIVLGTLLKKYTKYIEALLHAKKWRKNKIKGELLLNIDGANEERYEILKSPYFIKVHGEDNYSSGRYLLVKRFVNDIFKEKNKGKKRYIVLGGSGMGKSMFSMSLFEQYINKYNEANVPFPIYIRYLGKNNVIDTICSLSNNKDAGRSILILDALDENIEALKDTASFMKRLNEATDNFRFVIITSRIQLFENQQLECMKSDEPQAALDELNYEIIYISPFDDNDVKTYLENKYAVGSREYIKAKQISERAADTMSRPMILSFIDDLLNIDSLAITSNSVIYYEIICQWLRRECKFRYARNNNITISDLFTFSKKLAVYIYDKNKLEITKDEYEYFIVDNGYKENPYSFEGRSLIERNNDNKKFSHKSFMEFFIAVDILENPGKSYNLNGLDMVEIFVYELYEMYLKGDKFDYINYCIPKNAPSDLDLSQLKFLWDKLQNDEELCLGNNFICDLWQITLKKCVAWGCYLDNIRFRSIDVLRNNNRYGDDIALKIFKNKMFVLKKSLPIYYGINNLMKNIQRVFLECIFYKENVLTEDVYQILSNINENPILLTLKETILIFPVFFNMDNINYDEILNKYIPVIGSSFYGNASIYNVIEKVLNRKPYIPAIYVMKQSKNIDDIIVFVSELINRIKSEELKNITTSIIVESDINDVTITYVCDRNHSNEDVSTCLTNMYNIAFHKLNKTNKLSAT
ncbi:MAG: hypothetical protein IKW54_00215 [Bacteroidales bacterium]|nr:hypothetical protein [Bacteroidales bacterium]